MSGVLKWLQGAMRARREEVVRNVRNETNAGRFRALVMGGERCLRDGCLCECDYQGRVERYNALLPSLFTIEEAIARGEITDGIIFVVNGELMELFQGNHRVTRGLGELATELEFVRELAIEKQEKAARENGHAHNGDSAEQSFNTNVTGEGGPACS